MKKTLSFLLALCICFSLCTPCLAANLNANESISIEIYKDAIQKEGAKYGITCSILEYDPSIIITKEMLDFAIKDVRDYAESLNVVLHNDYTSTIMRTMPSTKDVYGDYTIVGKYGTVEIRATANVTVDMQNGAVMSINSSDAYRYGDSFNFRSFELLGITEKTNNPSVGYITLVVKSRVTFASTGPITGVVTGYTTDYENDIAINCR